MEGNIMVGKEYTKIERKKIDIFEHHLRNIYEMIGLGISLNDENFRFYSINKDDVQDLISNSILVNIDKNSIKDDITDDDVFKNNNQYTVSDLYRLYQYGIKLSADKQYLKATRCFYKCYESKPNNREYCLRMLLVYIKENCFQKAISMLSHIQSLDEERYSDDNIIYLYLYLLNMLVDCGKENNYKLEIFDPDTLIYNDKNKQMLQEQRNIRRAIYINKFKYAYQLLIDYMNLYHDYSIEYKLLRELLNQTVTKEEVIKRKINRFIKSEKYVDIIKILDELKKQRYLNSNETYIYFLSEIIINIKKTRKIPQITKIDTRYLYDAIKANDFVRAQELNKQYIIRTFKDMSVDPVNILLDRVNDLILQIEIELIDDSNKEKMQDNDIEITNLDEYANKELLFAEEIAYYIKEENLSIDDARKKIGIIPSQILLIKLIYARDYFIEGLDELAYELLREVENSQDKTEEVNRFFNEIRCNKEIYKKRDNSQLSKVKKII